MDDVSWPSVREAAWELQRQGETLFAMIDIESRAGLGWNDSVACRVRRERR